MKKYGLFGTGIQASKSPELMHNYMPYNNYRLFDAANTEEFMTFISMYRKTLNGANVTSPFKDVAYGIAQALTKEASLCRNCNCLAFANGFIIGHNTDYLAIYQVLQNLIETNETLCERRGMRLRNIRIGIMGTGPVARTSAMASKHFGEAFLLSRTKSGTDINDTPIHQYSKMPDRPDILINATPEAENRMLEKLGMPFSCRTGLPAIIDWNYKSGEKIDSSAGQYIDGFTLLKIQAQESVKFWSNFW